MKFNILHKTNNEMSTEPSQSYKYYLYFPISNERIFNFQPYLFDIIFLFYHSILNLAQVSDAS